MTSGTEIYVGVAMLHCLDAALLGRNRPRKKASVTISTWVHGYSFQKGEIKRERKGGRKIERGESVYLNLILSVYYIQTSVYLLYINVLTHCLFFPMFIL